MRQKSDGGLLTAPPLDLLASKRLPPELNFTLPEQQIASAEGFATEVEKLILVRLIGFDRVRTRPPILGQLFQALNRCLFLLFSDLNYRGLR